MKKYSLIAWMSIVFTTIGYPQVSDDDLIKLAKIYRNFHFASNSTKETELELNAITAKDLQASREFVSELIKTNNQIATPKYLYRPDSITLKYLFQIRSINWNLHEADPMDNHSLIDSLNRFPASTYEQLSCYYGMLFTSVGNKNRPLNMESTNLTLEAYGLKDDTEKGIFFLEGMETFGTYIWGYMNVVDPPNFKKALEVIENYPMFNGQPYYQFQDLNFKDFVLTVDKRKPKQSFKKYYINKYLNTLLYHSASLGQKKKTKDQQQEVMLGSIMRNEAYYQYSDNPDVFRRIFNKVKTD